MKIEVINNGRFNFIYKKGLTMNSVCAIIFLSCIISGCYSTTLVAPPGEKGSISYTQFNEKMGNGGARINLRDGRRVSGESIYVSHDSVSWTDGDSHNRLGVPMESVRDVVTVSRLPSTLLGFGIGAAIGVVIAISGTSGPHNDGGGLGFYWVIAPPGGALIGAGFGAAVGSRRSYEFKKESGSATPESHK